MGDSVDTEKANVDDKQQVKTSYDKDVEAGLVQVSTPEKDATDNVDDDFEEVIVAKDLQQRMGFLRSLRHGEEWLDAKMGIETQGIDRIKEENKKPPSTANAFFLWWSLNVHVGTLPIGILGPEFGLTLGQSVAAIVVGTMLGAMCPAYTSTLGPRLGLRAIATSRYSFGFWGAKLCSVLNIIVAGGFAVVNVVVVGQVLAAVSDYKMTLIVGCIIITVVSYFVSIFGFALIHTVEKYSWIGSFILMCVLIGQLAPAVDPTLPALDDGLGLSGAFLSFLAINFASASGWCSLAADYYCNYPADTKSWKIFTLTFWGISIPTIFITVIGACLSNAAVSNAAANPILADAYTNNGLGGLIREVYHPLGWSKFCLVLLTFSVLGNNVAIIYSSGLSLQLLGHYFHAVPRFIWSFLNALAIVILAIAGRQSLSTIVNNFVSMLGYWTVSFTIVLLIEDKYFRRHEGYNLLVWDQPQKLPWGAAAVFALLAGYLAGGVPGMAQTWYIGPIAAYFGPYGGDVGVFMSGVITVLVYPPLRWYERKRSGR